MTEHFNLVNYITNNTWLDIINTYAEKDIWIIMNNLINKCIKQNQLFYPPIDQVFRAFNMVNFKDIKVVIIGQDPYHNGLADGLAFSSATAIPKSLHNIFKLLKRDIPNFVIPNNGDLSKWANQGVLLINCSLTVLEHIPNSHAFIWNDFTDYILQTIKKDLYNNKIVFILWGNFAISKSNNIHNNNINHKIITGSHPSPIAGAKFFSGQYFTEANQFLKNNNIQEIDWTL